MDLHRTSSRAPVCDAERPPSGAFELPAASAAQFAHPDADTRIAARVREDQALDALEAQITQLWGHINAATAQFLALLTEFDRKEGWAQHGVASCAHWLSWQCGIGPVAAREKVRTARALESLPKIAEAFGEGRLSYSKVRALTRVATAATEDTLLHIALRGTAEHVERTVRGFRRVQRDIERNEAEAMHERRYLDCRRQSDGSVRLEARLAPEVGEMLLKALEAAEAQLDERGGDAEGTRGAKQWQARRHRARRSGRVCAFGMRKCFRGRNPALDRCRGNGEVRRLKAFPRKHPLGAPASGARMRWNTSSSDFSPGSAVRVRPRARTSWWCTSPTMRCVTCRRAAGASFEHGGKVAVETARRLGCDGALLGVVKGAQGEPLAVGRRTRAVPPAIRRALRVRDGGCRFPGCDRSRHVHAHHIRHWADGGETALDNLVTLCSQHHRQVHEGGYGVRVRQGAIEFTRPDGRVIPPAGKTHRGCFRGNTCAADGAQRLAAFNAARGLAINAHTARCGWGGERMDYNIAIDTLCWEAGHT